MALHKRIILIIILIAALTGSAMAGEVVVPFIGGDARTTSIAGGGTDLSINNFTSTYSPGDPALPYIEKYVLLPPNADPSSLRVVVRKAVVSDVTGTFDIAPAPPAVAGTNDKRIEWWGKGKQIKNGRNALIYGKDALYPSNHVSISQPERLGNYILVSVQFWPYRYNPIKKKLVHLKGGEVAVTFNSKAANASASTGDPFEAERLKSIAINYQQANSWYSIPPAAQSAAAASPIPFAIITTQAIVNSSTKLSAYIAHKTSMGFNVTLATEAQWGGGTGDLAAEGIHRWLRLNYTTKARYALLIGNPSPSADVPMKLLWPRRGAGDGSEDCPSDYYYADMTGNWDYNDNGYYGEYPGDFVGTWGIDRIPEVIVGRIPYYGNTTELDSILQKIINYEAATTVGPWADRALLPMEPLDTATPCWQIGEAIKNDTLMPNGINYYRIYQENYGLVPVPEKTPCNEDNVKNEWKNGYGFVFWSTHGGSTSAVDIFSTGSQSVLDDSRPAFTFQGSCWNGQPEDTYNLGYSLLKQGAIATLSASRVSWYYPGQTEFKNSDSDGGMAYLYASKLIKDRQRCGDAFFNMNTSLPNNIWMNHIVFNLYGDPTVIARKATSFSIENESLPSAYLGQSYTVNMQAAGGQIPYTWTIASGSLPPGFTLSSTGSLTGTAQRSGLYNFTVEVTDNNGQVATRNLSLAVVLTAYNFDLSTYPGWTCEGSWAYGKPAGKGTISIDPSSGHTGDYVFGYNLNGDYENGMVGPKYLTTSAIDCSSLAKTTISFWRWLGVSSDDRVSFDASNDGVNWTTVWANSGLNNSVMDYGWFLQTYDISAIADGHSTVFFRWGMGPTDSSYCMGGWNIDDIQITGALIKPLISHTQLSTTENTTSPYTVTANVIAPAQLATGSPALVYKTTGSFVTVPMTLTSDNTYAAQIPPKPAGTTVVYYFTATDTKGTAVSPVAAPAQCYQFQVISDTEAPVITHTPLADTRDAVGPYNVVATIDDRIGIASAKLNWSKNGGPVTTVDMTKSTNPAKPNDYLADIPGPAASGDWYNYTITAKDSSAAGNQATSPVQGDYMFNIIPGVTRIYNFPMDTDPGWSCTGMWAFGTPLGIGSRYYRDPTSGHTGPYVYGYNLAGNYLDNMAAAETLTTTPIDCSHIQYATLKFWRNLGIEGTIAGDYANILASDNGTDWTTIWNNPTYMILDYMWTQQSYDISALADGKNNFRIRWDLGPTGPYSNYCGWNIDDVEIWGIWHDTAATVGALKSTAGNTAVTIDGAIVSAAYQGYFYVQDANGYLGIKVLWPGSVVEGTPVSIRGVIRTRNGELELVAETVTPGEFAGTVTPVWMSAKSLGGADLGNPTVQKGTKSQGTNNIGTLVKIAGKVTQIGNGYFYVNDGSNVKDGTTTNGEENIGARVKWTGTGRTKGEFITITGISTGFISGSEYIGEVLPRRGTDINP